MSYNLGPIDPDQRAELFAERGDEDPPPQPRRVLAAAAAIVVMALFAGGLWFAYVEGARHASGSAESGAAPLIRADPRPMKVRPAAPGGMQIPDRDKLIYGERRPVVEHLLPPPETPMARPAPPPAPPPPPAETAAAPAVAPSPEAASGAAPEAAPEAARAPGGPAPTGAPAPVAAAAPARQLPAPPSAKPHAVSTKPAATRAAPAQAGGTRLQLGSVRSEELARREWDRIKRGNPDLLGNLSAVAIRADLGDKGVYYRIETAPVGDAAMAERICSELRQRHLGCIIAR